jgi:Metal-independent alpha-mannosidase (GH125)
MRQLLTSATNDAMHESVNPDFPARFTRPWFEWANALFVLYVEITLGVRCDVVGSEQGKKEAAKIGIGKAGSRGLFFTDPYRNDPSLPEHYQGEVASVIYDRP